MTSFWTVEIVECMLMGKKRIYFDIDKIDTPTAKISNEKIASNHNKSIDILQQFKDESVQDFQVFRLPSSKNLSQQPASSIMTCMPYR